MCAVVCITVGRHAENVAKVSEDPISYDDDNVQIFFEKSLKDRKNHQKSS